MSPNEEYTYLASLGIDWERFWEEGELPIMAKSEKALRIIHCGTSQDVEYLEGKINQSSCGGGKKAGSYNCDEWEE